MLSSRTQGLSLRGLPMRKRTSRDIVCFETGRLFRIVRLRRTHFSIPTIVQVFRTQFRRLMNLGMKVQDLGPWSGQQTNKSLSLSGSIAVQIILAPPPGAIIPAV